MNPGAPLHADDSFTIACYFGGRDVRKAFPQLVADLVKAKEATGLSEVYLRDLRGRLGRFAEAFPSPIGMILANDIQNYVRDLKRGPRSKNNTRKAIKTLFTFAQTRGYLPKGLTEASDLQRVKEQAKPIGMFTPEQMAAWLKHAAQTQRVCIM